MASKENAAALPSRGPESSARAFLKGGERVTCFEVSLFLSISTQDQEVHTSHGEGDHRPLRLSGLPAAHTFFGVNPQSPAPFFTVHSVKCNWSALSPSGLPPSPQRQSLYVQ